MKSFSMRTFYVRAFWIGGKGDGGASPCPRRAASIFRAAGWSIDRDAGTGRCSVTSARGLPMPTVSKLGGRSLKLKVPL